MKMSNKLLVAVDFTESPTDILSRILTLHPEPETEILLLHVIPEIQHTSYYIESMHPWIDLHKNSIEAAIQTMKRYIKELSIQFPKITPIVKNGIAHDKIVETANEYDVDYIIMGDHCRTGWQHFFHSNVAEHVIRNAKRDVLSFYVPA